jgi:hypothetical protein
MRAANLVDDLLQFAIERAGVRPEPVVGVDQLETSPSFAHL